MDEATQQKLADLQAAENEALAAFEEACAKNGDLHDRAVDDDQPTPSTNERLAVHEEIIQTEAALHEVQDKIRKILWADAGIEEGAPVTIGPVDKAVLP